MTDRLQLPASQVAPAAHAHMAAYHADAVSRVAEAVRRHDVVVVGMAQNPHVYKARRALAAAGVAFEYLELGSYLSQWRPRLAIKLWSGWPTFPQVFVRGVLIGGASDLRKALADGTLRQRLEAPR